MLESQVEKSVCEFARRNKMLAFKLNGPGNVGKPDRLFLYNGKSVFIEFKAPGKKPTELQSRWLRQLTESGFIADWVDNPADGIALLRKHLL